MLKERGEDRHQIWVHMSVQPPDWIKGQIHIKLVRGVLVHEAGLQNCLCAKRLHKKHNQLTTTPGKPFFLGR